MVRKLTNAILFYCGWLIVVANAAAGLPWVALSAGLCVTVYHLFSCRWRRRELFLIIGVTTAGFIIETGYIRYLILAYASPNPLSPELAPLWILTLYAMFATTINSSMEWLKPYLLAAALFGALGGMMSYAAGAYMGAVRFLVLKESALLVAAVVWALLLPLIYLFNGWLEGLEPDGR